MQSSREATAKRLPRLATSDVFGLIKRWQARQRIGSNRFGCRSAIFVLRRLLVRAAHVPIAVSIGQIIGRYPTRSRPGKRIATRRGARRKTRQLSIGLRAERA